ncbi:ATP-binding protein [Acholeplasma hippikon]|uniref:Sensor histidine kinase NatK-like C-terminal domain-containing protein n=1 Tax=Acholeplasma hippikon TaxID=264636 RepID=A0A449BLC9_9MOLU|nr:ATP-binding protein [Acholeplasma hippikon]VEU83239.1 Uncharacterised protein [Acholeplasma hippikon]
MIYAALAVLLLYNVAYVAYFIKLSPAKNRHRYFIIGLLILFQSAVYIIGDKNFPLTIFILNTAAIYVTIRLVTNLNMIQGAFAAGMGVINVNSIRNIINATFSIMFINDGNFYLINDPDVYHVVTLLAFPVAMAIFIILRAFIFEDLKMKRFLYANTPLRLVVIYQLFSVVNLVLINSVSLVNRQAPILSIEYYMAIGVTCLIIIYMMYVVMYYTIKYFERQRIESRNAMLVASYEQQLSHYKKLENFYNSYRKFKHDYEGVVGTLRNMVNNSENQEAKDTLEQMDQLVYNALELPKRYSNNMIFDALMQELATKCKENNITLTFEGSEPMHTHLTLLEKISLFHNLTSNAYEATLKVKDESKRYIYMKITNQENWASIYIENSYNGKLKQEHGKYMTTKKDVDSHGFGLENIIDITKRLGGFYTIEPNLLKEVFTVSVLLPRDLKKPIIIEEYID